MNEVGIAVEIEEAPKEGFTAGEIKAIRQTLGLSQEKFARLIGADKRSVVRWEKGEHRATPHGVHAIVLTAIKRGLDPRRSDDPGAVKRFLYETAQVGGLGYMLHRLFEFVVRG